MWSLLLHKTRLGWSLRRKFSSLNQMNLLWHLPIVDTVNRSLACTFENPHGNQNVTLLEQVRLCFQQQADLYFPRFPCHPQDQAKRRFRLVLFDVCKIVSSTSPYAEERFKTA
jgi:hypothetical protein